jgi:hypothetical protein
MRFRTPLATLPRSPTALGSSASWALWQALAADSQMLGRLGRDAIFDSLRTEPRFVALRKRLRYVT